MHIMMGRCKRLLRPNFLLILLIPLAATLLLGGFLEKQQKELVIPIGIVDLDESDFSKELIRGMNNQEMLLIYEVSSEEGNELLERNEVDSVFVIKPGFKEQLLKEGREETIELWISPNSVLSGVIQEVVASEVTKITSAIKASNKVQQLYKRNHISSDFVWQDAYDFTLKQWEPEPLMTINYMEDNKLPLEQEVKTEGTSLFVPYMGIWSFFTMSSCFIASVWVVKERPILFFRIRTTYKGLASYLRQTAGAFLLFYCGQAVLSFFILSHFGWIKRESTLLAGMFAFVIVSLSLGIWLASFFQHLGAYYVAGLLVTFILTIVGGGFFSISEFSSSLEVLSSWLPYQLLEEKGSGEGWKLLFITLGSSLLFGGWSVWRLRV